MPVFDFDARSAHATLELRGELDVATVGIAGAQFAELLAAGAHDELTIDLSGLSFIDSSGITLLRAAASRCAARGVGLRIVPGAAAVQRVFALTGTDRALPFAPSTTAAVSAA